MKPVLAVDMDETLVDSLSVWVEKYNEVFQDSINPSIINDWNANLFCKKCTPQQLRNLRWPEMYRAVQPIPLAREMLSYLKRDYYIVVLTSEISRTFAREKKSALDRLFNGCYDELVLSHNKRNTLNFKELVDDGVHNKPTILFDQPWNRSVEHEKRAFGWVSVYNYLTS